MTNHHRFLELNRRGYMHCYFRSQELRTREGKLAYRLSALVDMVICQDVCQNDTETRAERRFLLIKIRPRAYKLIISQYALKMEHSDVYRQLAHSIFFC